MPPEKLHWSHLYREVVTSGLCTGCSACVVVCPYDVLGYDDQNGVYRPFHVAGDGRDGQLHPRREGLHPLHEGLPAVPLLGARGRHVPLRSRARGERGVRHRAGRDPRPGHRSRAAGRPARTAVSSRRC